jgi:hypothetical protein
MSEISGPGVIPLSGDGNLIGVTNAPTEFVASGLWQPPEVLKARAGANWPFVIGGYDITNDWIGSPGGPAQGKIRQITESSDVQRAVWQGGAFGAATTQGGVFSSQIRGYIILATTLLRRFRFSTDTIEADASAWPDATTSRLGAGSCQSTTNGYAWGGEDTAAYRNTSAKWAFSTDARTMMGNLPVAMKNAGGTNTATNAYALGGQTATANRNQILRLPFATDVWATISATLTASTSTGANRLGTSSTNGYSPNPHNRFTFSTETITSLTALDPLPLFDGVIYSSPTRYAVSVSNFSSLLTIRFVDFATETYQTNTVQYSVSTDRPGGFFPQ